MLRKVAVGGTFDELHKGHRVLLMKAFETGSRVLIGLCTDEFVKNLKKPHLTAPYDERLNELKEFLVKLGVSGRFEIIPLDEPFGPTTTDETIDGLVVSQETESTATRINEQRKKHRLKELKIVTVNMVPSQNCKPISTTRIRRGEMDREGRLFEHRSPSLRRKSGASGVFSKSE